MTHALQPFAQMEAAVVDLTYLGLQPRKRVYGRLPPPCLIEAALSRGEGVLSDRGALVTRTGERTGRSPLDRFLVREPSTEDKIAWGAVNKPISPETFEHLKDRTIEHVQSRDLFVCDAWAGADPKQRLPVRVVADQAWHAQFAQCMLIRPSHEELADFRPELTVLSASKLRVTPERDGTRSEAFVILNLRDGVVLIGGTEYAGEIKKSVFSFLNYLLPQGGVLSMHCSANIGPDDDTALFFGLSGTGKTTLSADPKRRLIGDDEHGWSDEGIFNIEGGCYAKCIDLAIEREPQIYNALRFGSVLENVVLDPETRRPDFADDALTENTRAAYPVHFIDNAEPSSRGDHPRNIIFLTCDAFGVMPPLSRLTSEQALYHFLCGYTAKVAGTEAGVTEPEATFSACFGAPFLPLPPTQYAEMLRQRIQKHDSQVWLINTGWIGGPPGRGNRIDLAHTRAMVDAALNGSLADVKFTPDPIFQVHVPASCPNVPPEVLRPGTMWKNQDEYQAQSHKLTQLFQKAFANFADRVPPDVRSAGPQSR